MKGFAVQKINQDEIKLDKILSNKDDSSRKNEEILCSDEQFAENDSFDAAQVFEKDKSIVVQPNLIISDHHDSR